MVARTDTVSTGRAWTEVPLRARLVRVFTATPGPALAGDVEHLFWIEASAPLPAPALRGCAAKAAVDLVLTLEGHFAEGAERALLARGERAPYLVGPMSAAAEVVSSGRCVAVGARLRPGRAAALLRTHMDALRDGVARLDDLSARAVRDSGASAAGGPEEAAAALERALLALRARAGAPDPLVDGAVQLIAAARGRLPVEALAHRLGTSVRQLQRRFRARVGLSPKRGCRIARVEHAAALLAGPSGMAEVAAAAGFYDQAHLVREFGALAGRTPGAVRRAPAQCA